MDVNSGKKLAIIGGGAAGLMAAATVVENEINNGFDGEVFLFEKNTYLGAKVLISGGGRCNVTTGIFDVKKLLQNYPRGAKFLISAFYNFPPEKVMEWFENHNVALKIEDDLRVFPESNNGKDVVGAFEKIFKNGRVKIFLNSQAVKINKPASSKFEISLKDGTEISVDKVLLTTGGNAYSHTGSTGDGYKFAENLGHTITPLAPSLHSFKVAEKWISSLAGISFDKVKIALSSADNDVLYSRTGPILFTHFGITGPAIFALSSMSAHQKFDQNHPMKMSINFFPEQPKINFEKHFTDLANKNGAKFLLNFLDFFLPKSLCQTVIDLAGDLETSAGRIRPSADQKVARLSKEQRTALINLLFDLPLRIVGCGAGDEFVTAGGVDCSEVDSRTMESKICPGLFFAGEILDIDGFTGGFNLQAAWATGRLAGLSMMKNLK